MSGARQLNFFLTPAERDAIVKRYRVAAMKAAEWTAIDVARSAKSSIKSGGKTRRSKNWQTSKPGEAPRSHVGTLKQAIRYQQSGDASFVVGPEQHGSSGVLRALEHGGKSIVHETAYDDAYVAGLLRRKRRLARSARSVDVSAVRVRPKAARKYTLYTKNNPKRTTIADYLRFYSRDAWERARTAAAFQQWASEQRTTESRIIDVERRPFMRPALAVAAGREKTAARMTRALKSF